MVADQDYTEHTIQEKLRLFRLEHEEIAGGKSGNTAGHQQRSAQATFDNYNKTMDADTLRRRQAFVDAMLINIITDLNDLAAANEAKIAENNIKISRLDEQINILEEMLKAAENDEILSLTEEQERLLREFEDEYGVKIDRDNSESIKAALDRANDEKLVLERENEVLEKEAGLAREAAQEIERIMAIEDLVLRDQELQSIVFKYEAMGETGERILEATKPHIEEAATIAIAEIKFDSRDELDIKEVVSSTVLAFNQSSAGMPHPNLVELDVSSNGSNRPTGLDFESNESATNTADRPFGLS